MVNQFYIQQNFNIDIDNPFGSYEAAYEKINDLIKTNYPDWKRIKLKPPIRGIHIQKNRDTIKFCILEMEPHILG